jgi:hypothetical protein
MGEKPTSVMFLAWMLLMYVEILNFSSSIFLVSWLFLIVEYFDLDVIVKFPWILPLLCITKSCSISLVFVDVFRLEVDRGICSLLGIGVCRYD